MGWLEFVSRKDKGNIIGSDTFEGNDRSDELAVVQTGDTLFIDFPVAKELFEAITNRVIPGVQTFLNTPLEKPAIPVVTIETVSIQKQHYVPRDWMGGSGWRISMDTVVVQAQTEEGEDVAVWIQTGKEPEWLKDMPYPLYEQTQG